MTKFAAFAPDGASGRRAFRVRPARPEDAAQIARIDSERSGDAVAEVLPKVRRELEALASGAGDWITQVAEDLDGVVLGYARAGCRTYGADPDARNVPTGWFLLGVVVDPSARRNGVGRALTQARIEAVRARGATELHYFTNARNPVSLRLHAALGFEEVSRDIVVPRVPFDGGVGVLCRLALTA